MISTVAFNPGTILSDAKYPCTLLAPASDTMVISALALNAPTLCTNAKDPRGLHALAHDTMVISALALNAPTLCTKAKDPRGLHAHSNDAMVLSAMALDSRELQSSYRILRLHLQPKNHLLPVPLTFLLWKLEATSYCNAASDSTTNLGVTFRLEQTLHVERQKVGVRLPFPLRSFLALVLRSEFQDPTFGTTRPLHRSGPSSWTI